MPPRGVSTARSRAASKKNGAAGAKHGKKGGRPAAALSEAELAVLGDPPFDDAVAMLRWYAKLNAMAVNGRARGRRGMAELLADITKATNTAVKLIAPDAVFAAHEKLRQGEQDMASTEAGGELEDLDDDE